MSRQVHDFLSGFGSVLALSPEHDEPNFCYHGKDLTEIQVEDALRGDWEIVGKGLFDAIGQIDDDERCAERLNQIGR